MDNYEFHNLIFNSGVSDEVGIAYYDMENCPIEKMLKNEPENYNLRIRNAHLFATFGLLEQSIVNWDMVCELNPREFRPYWNKGHLLFKNRQYDEALNCYDTAIENCPSEIKKEEIRNQEQDWIEWYNNGGKISDYEKSMQKYLKPINDLINTGLRLYETNLDKSALTKFDEALGINPNYSVTLLYKGNLFSKMERYEDAIACYNRAINIHHAFAQLYFFKAITLTRMNCFTDALECYDKAIGLKERYAPAIFYKAKLLFYLERYEDAIFYFNRLSDADSPFSVNSRFMSNIEKKWDGKPTPYYR